MEKDRAATNLGPETLEEVEAAAFARPKQPRRRFIGKRAADEKAAAEATLNGNSTTTSLTLAKPARTARTINTVPASITEDPSINEAIDILPSNYNFEIHKTIHRIRTLAAKNVALQFPEGLLMFAPLISDILTRFCPGTDTLIMGDVTYGACCIDDYTARALGCDLLVHYGHSCLVPVDQTGGIKTLYVFVTIGIDVEHLLKTIERNFQAGKRIALVGTIQFNTTLHAIVPKLRELGFDPVLPRSAPLSAGEILGCTAPSLTATSRINKASVDELNSKSKSPVSDADMILYVGDGRFHLESILIASPSLRTHTYRYDPYSRRLTHETYEHEDMHSLRRSAIREARRSLRRGSSKEVDRQSPVTLPTKPQEPGTWAIILGTLGRQGNPHTLDLLTLHLDRLKMPWITLLLSEVTPAKLSLMSRDVAVFVQIACPRLSIDWGYAFERPLLSPYEALVAVGARGEKWMGSTQDGGIGGDGARTIDARVGNGDHAQRGADDDVGIYPMDFYERSGLGRTNQTDLDRAMETMEIEVR